MNGSIEFRVIGVQDLAELESFYNTIEKGKHSFRYFEKRPFTIIENHLVTLLLFKDGYVLGYGHLDFEDGQVWLGVVVSDGAHGNGYGKLIVSELLKIAEKRSISTVKLSVDNNNHPAKSIYEKMGFLPIEKNENITLYQLDI